MRSGRYGVVRVRRASLPHTAGTAPVARRRPRVPADRVERIQSCWVDSGTGGALRTTAAAPSRPASHRCMLGKSHVDCSVAVKVRSTETVIRGGHTHGSPGAWRRRFGLQTDARRCAASIPHATQSGARARIHRVSCLCLECHGSKREQKSAHDDTRRDARSRYTTSTNPPQAPALGTVDDEHPF
jgi:hypothetical protein